MWQPPGNLRPTRERLIRAAVFLFQNQGYHGAGLAAILARARAPKGSLYHHFPGGKEDLAIAAVDWLGAEVDGFLDARLREGLGGRDLVLALVGRQDKLTPWRHEELAPFERRRGRDVV